MSGFSDTTGHEVQHELQRDLRLGETAARDDVQHELGHASRPRILWRLIGEGLWLGSTVFGGMNQAYPIMREGGWLPTAEVDGLYAVSVFLPGPSFLNLWGSIAARVAGLTGAILGQAALLLPAFLLVLALPLLGHVPWFAARASGALAGSTWATAGILISTGIGLLRKQKAQWQIWLAAGALALAALGVNPLVLLVGAVAVGVAIGRPAAGGPTSKGAR